MSNLDFSLERLERSGLIRLAQLEPEIEYLFKHALFQETAYGMMVRNQRKALHRQVGESLEALYPDRREELAATLAHHFAEGGDSQKALRYFTQAGDEAARRYATGEAIIHFSRALQIIEQGAQASPEMIEHLYMARGRAYELAQQYAEALANYVEMNATSTRRGLRKMELNSLTARATLLSLPTTVQNAIESRKMLEQARALAHELNDPTTESRVLWTLLLNILYTGGDPQEGVAYGLQSLDLARQHDLREQIAFTQHDLIRMRSAAGDNDSAHLAFTEAASLWRELNNLPMLADSHNAVAMMDAYDGQLSRAMPIAQEGRRLANEVGDVWSMASNNWLVGRILFEQGQISMAIRDISDSVAASVPIGHPIAAFTSADLGTIYAFVGDHETGIALCERAIQLTRGSAVPLVQRLGPWPYAVKARFYAQTGQLDNADAVIAQSASMDVTDIPGLAPLSVHVRLARIEIALARQLWGPAVVVCDELIAHLRDHRLRLWLPETLLLKGRALLGAERADEAAETLASARQIAEQQGAIRLIGPILSRLAEAMRGDESQAGALRAEALRARQQLAAAIDEPELKARFMALSE